MKRRLQIEDDDGTDDDEAVVGMAAAMLGGGGKVKKKKKKDKQPKSTPPTAPTPTTTTTTTRTSLPGFNIKPNPIELAKRQARAQRFEKPLDGVIISSSSPSKPEPQPGGGDYRTAKPLQGTCTTLEKHYYRLTSDPDPRTIRPLPVLVKALDMVKKRWLEEEDYTYVCSQLKAIRQDLRVQHIYDDFTVKVYETHARIALETGDLNEYNICSSQLSSLHKEHGLDLSVDGEFAAYKLLYALYYKSNTEVMAMMDRYRDLRHSVPMAHATQVVIAYHTTNYYRFFLLYNEAPHMSAYLMDFLVNRMRVAGYQRMLRSYLPTLPTNYIKKTMSFFTDKECVEFLKAQGGVVTSNSGGEAKLDVLDIKASRANAASR